MKFYQENQAVSWCKISYNGRNFICKAVQLVANPCIYVNGLCIIFFTYLKSVDYKYIYISSDRYKLVTCCSTGYLDDWNTYSSHSIRTESQMSSERIDAHVLRCDARKTNSQLNTWDWRAIACTLLHLTLLIVTVLTPFRSAVDATCSETQTPELTRTEITTIMNESQFSLFTRPCKREMHSGFWRAITVAHKNFLTRLVSLLAARSIIGSP